jgi:hypothetical protein
MRKINVKNIIKTLISYETIERTTESGFTL